MLAIVIQLVISLLLILMADASMAEDIITDSKPEYHGLISMEDYYSSDSGSAYDFNFLTTRVRLDAAKLNKTGTLSFHFDGRERNNLGARDYSSKIKNERIDILNLEYTGLEHINLAAGRLWPRELPAEQVDGVNILYQQVNFGAGFFGGAKPDPYTGEINTDFTSLGGYVIYRKGDLAGTLAFIHNGYKGEIDRQYLYGQYSWSPLKEIMLYGSITADINQITDDLNLTNAFLEFTYRPDYQKNITLGYNQFKAYRLYQSMNFDIIDSEQQSLYIRGDYKFLEQYTVYGRYELQTLHYQALDSQLSEADIYLIGFRNDNLMKLNITLDLNASLTDNYSSNYSSVNLHVSHFITETFQLTMGGSYMQTRYDLVDYEDRLLSYDVSGYLILNRKWSLSASFEGKQGEDYSTNVLVSRISYRF